MDLKEIFKLIYGNSYIVCLFVCLFFQKIISKLRKIVFKKNSFEASCPRNLMHASKDILNLPTSSLHLCSPSKQNR